MHAREKKQTGSVEQPVLYGPGASPTDVRVTGVRDWRFNQRAEDIEWLLRLSAADGSASTVSWQILYNISSQQQWSELQRFLLPKLNQLRAFCQSQCIQKPGTESGSLFQPTPHAFKPWKRDFIVDWRHSRARDQLLFLVKQFDEAGVTAVCEEWCEVVPGNLPMWLMVKNYLMQYILLEATYLRSSCCITGLASAADQEVATAAAQPVPAAASVLAGRAHGNTNAVNAMCGSNQQGVPACFGACYAEAEASWDPEQDHTIHAAPCRATAAAAAETGGGDGMHAQAQTSAFATATEAACRRQMKQLQEVQQQQRQREQQSQVNEPQQSQEQQQERAREHGRMQQEREQRQWQAQCQQFRLYQQQYQHYYHQYQQQQADADQGVPAPVDYAVAADAAAAAAAAAAAGGMYGAAGAAAAAAAGGIYGVPNPLAGLDPQALVAAAAALAAAVAAAAAAAAATSPGKCYRAASPPTGTGNGEGQTGFAGLVAHTSNVAAVMQHGSVFTACSTGGSSSGAAAAAVEQEAQAETGAGETAMIEAGDAGCTAAGDNAAAGDGQGALGGHAAAALAAVAEVQAAGADAAATVDADARGGVIDMAVTPAPGALPPGSRANAAEQVADLRHRMPQQRQRYRQRKHPHSCECAASISGRRTAADAVPAAAATSLDGGGSTGGRQRDGAGAASGEGDRALSSSYAVPSAEPQKSHGCGCHGLDIGMHPSSYSQGACSPPCCNGGHAGATGCVGQCDRAREDCGMGVFFQRPAPAAAAIAVSADGVGHVGAIAFGIAGYLGGTAGGGSADGGVRSGELQSEDSSWSSSGATSHSMD